MSNTKRTRATGLGPHPSEGLRRLRLAMEQRGWRARELADALGVDHATPHAWLWADRKPDLDKAVLISRELGIPVELWTAPPSRPLGAPGERPRRKSAAA